MPPGTVRTAPARISASHRETANSSLPDHYVDPVGELQPVPRVRRLEADGSGHGVGAQDVRARGLPVTRGPSR
jgi:hypothetical protein